MPLAETVPPPCSGQVGYTRQLRDFHIVGPMQAGGVLPEFPLEYRPRGIVAERAVGTDAREFGSFCWFRAYTGSPQASDLCTSRLRVSYLQSTLRVEDVSWWE